MKTVTGGGREEAKAVGRLLATALIARLADQGAALGVVLVILARTHSAALAGLVAGAFSFPALFTGPVIGAWLDRLPAKRALFVTNQAVLTACLIAIDAVAGRSPALVLVALGLAAGLTAPVITGGFTSLIPLLTTPDRLTRANVADSATYDIAGLAGPALVALAASLAGASGAMVIVAGISGVGVLGALAAPMPRALATGPGEGFAAAIADGMHMIVRRPLLAAATTATTSAQIPEGVLPVVLPLLAVATGSRASAGGWLLTAASAGGLVGTAVSGRLIEAHGPRAVMSVAMGLAAVPLAALAAVPPLAATLPLAVLFGVTTGPVLTATFTIRQREVPTGRYAQLSATAASLKVGAHAAGSAVAGLAAAALGVRGALLCAAAVQLASVTPLVVPLRRGDT